MPRHFFPQRSGVHRAACFALYRALLRQTQRLSTKNERYHATQQKVRSRLRGTFQHNAKIQSPNLVVHALRQGYDALDKLHDALNGDNDAHGYLLQKLDTLKPKPCLKPSAARHKSGRNGYPSHTQDRTAKPELASAPTSILARPYPVLSGRRTVPHLISANGIPFLRYKRPQPPALSRVLDDRAKAYQNRWDKSFAYQQQEQLGKLEDAWDRELFRYCGLSRGHDLGPSWSEESNKALDDLFATVRRQTTRNRTMAMKMYHVMEKERELAVKEKLARRDERHRRYKAKRLTRRGVAEAEDVPLAMTG